MQKPCPCHSGNPYQNCCAPFHLGDHAPTAEQLMRSRYSAYVLKLVDYLNNTWHLTTRPNDLTLESLHGMKWRGLTVINHQTIGATHATVTFEARYQIGQQKTQTMHETSYFVLEDGLWLYVGGDIKD